ncbi:MAG: hypothetical protein HOO96_37355 [Polyangiaceae bacterium]|nr:hypothetical protein [Polyangiaceae bacterium]
MHSRSSLLVLLFSGLVACATPTGSDAVGSDVSALTAESASATWTELAPAKHPGARSGAAMAYDPTSRKLVLFGGYDGVHRDDTWVFDGVTWTRVRPPVSPPGRASAAFALDDKSGKLVLFGGYDGRDDLGDTWLWDGATSTWVDAHPTHAPTARTMVAGFADPTSRRAHVLGGFIGSLARYSNEMWRWTGNDWQQRTPAHLPTGRAAMFCATDPIRKTVTVFGGLAQIDPVNTWTWDGADWTRETPAAQPPWRYLPGGAYDPGLAGVVLFGGGNGGVSANDTWVWSGTTWTQASTSGPAPRENVGLALFEPTSTVVLFGGEKGGSTRLYGDTWTLSP